MTRHIESRLSQLEQRLKPNDPGSRWIMIEVYGLLPEQKEAAIAQAERENPDAKLIIIDCVKQGVQDEFE